MARVHSVAQAWRRHTGGGTLDIAAPTLRALLAELETRHPGLGDELAAQMAVAVDGEIHHDDPDLPLAPDAEVVFIPRITAG